MNSTNLVHDILTSPAGSFASVFALFALAFWLTYWITKKVTEIKSEHGTLTTHLKETEGRLEKRIDSIDVKIDDIRTNFAYIKGIVEVNSSSFAKRKSPISLTEKGIEMGKTLHAEEIVDRNWSKIFANLEENIHDKNPYDVQEYIKKGVAVEPEKYFSNDDLLGIKDFAFKQGQTLMYYSIIFAIIIRDKYLKEIGIDIDEIDRHDPNRYEKTD